VTLTLRPAAAEDIAFFHRLQQDPVAVRMAAFTSAQLGDRELFEARWQRVLSHPTNRVLTVLDGTERVGQVLAYESDGGTEVSYWVERSRWGQGIATEALRLLLMLLPQRPLHARVAHDNVGSLAVLRHHGFVVTGEDVAHAEGRAELVKEYVLMLSATPGPEPHPPEGPAGRVR
jgi:RimJ/RimL family protein N-acetyltransferase